MAEDSGPPPPAGPTELAPDRCPNCGGKLKFSENRPEGLCAACGIFVEVLRPSPPKPPVRPLPSKIKIRTATTRELLVLCHKYGLPRGGSKQDLVDRLLMYVDEQGWQAKVTAKKSETPAPVPTEDVASRKQWATFLLDYESEVEEESPDAKKEKAAPAEPSQAEGAEPAPESPVEPQGEPVPVETVGAPAANTTPEPKPPEAPTEPAPLEEQARERPEPPEEESPAHPIEEAEVPPQPEAEAVPEPAPGVEGEVPAVEEEIVAPEPVAEPEVEPVAAESVAQVVPAPAERPSPLFTAQVTPAQSRAPPAQRSRWRRAMYYVGVFYVSIGGAGLILGSILHDLFRIPLIGRSYDAFGRLNIDAVFIGAVLLAVGLAAIAVGMRRTATRAGSAAGA